MVQRSYLYSSNQVPGPADQGVDELELAGLGEFEGGIPIVYRLLMAQARPCHSVIWDSDEQIALAADYDAGLARLRAFLSQIDAPQAQPLVREALAVLEDPENRQAYLVLETAELFAAGESSLQEQNRTLMAELDDVDTQAAQALEGFREALASEGDGDSVGRALRAMGLGSWSDTLHYDREEE